MDFEKEDGTRLQLPTGTTTGELVDEGVLEVKLMSQPEEAVESALETPKADDITEAQSDLYAVQNKIKAAEAEAKTSLIKRDDALKALSKVEKQIKEAKSKFLDTLGG